MVTSLCRSYYDNFITHSSKGMVGENMTEEEALALIPLWKKEFERKYGRLTTNTDSDPFYGKETRWVGKLDQFGHIIPFELKEVLEDLTKWINEEYIKKEVK